MQQSLPLEPEPREPPGPRSGSPAHTPERIFLPWDRPALIQAAEVLVEAYAGGEEGREEGLEVGAGSSGVVASGLVASGVAPSGVAPSAAASTPGEARMDGAVVVVPGARAGRRLKELLVEVAEARDVRLVPPRIVTMGRLPELLHEPGRPAASPVVRRLAWGRALRETPPERLAAVFARRPDDDALLEWTALGREAAELSRQVAAGGYRFRDVARRCAGAPFFDDAERWRVLAEVQDRVEARLGAAGLVDPDLGRMDALGSGGVHLDGDLWLVGVAEMPEVIRRMLRASGAPIRVLVHAPADRGDAFDDLGCVQVEAWGRAPLTLDESRVILTDRPADQAAAVARILRGLGGARAAEEITLGVPDREVVPFLEERLGGAGVPVRDAAGTPVAASGPARLLGAVADVLDGRRFEAVAALVRHPDLAPWISAEPAGEEALARVAGWLTPLDRWQRDHLPARMVAPYAGAGWRRDAVQALMARLDDGLLADLGGTRPLSGWVRPVLELLAAVYETHGLRPDRLRDRRLVAALDRLRGAAESFAGLPESLDAPCRAPEALRLVLDQAASASLPPDAADAAVEMLGWLELHLDDAPVAVLTGMNEGAVPESVRGHPFLPDTLARHLGLEDNRLRHARDVYRTAAKLHAREEIHLVLGRRSGEGDPLRPSRLLFQADDATVARRVRRFYGVEETGGGVAASDGDGAAAGGGVRPGADGENGRRAVATAAAGPEPSESGFVLPPEPAIEPGPLLERLRVTDFGPLLTDPYTVALRRVRRAEPLDDHAREMDGRLFGTVAHDVLERFGSSDAVHETDPEVVAAALDALLDQDERSRFGPHARVAVRLQLEQLRARLGAFAAWHASRVAEGWRVVAVEAATPEDGVPFEVDGEAVGLVARIDRVEHHPERDEWAVFDYKTGDRGDGPEKVHRKGRSLEKEWVDLQLPLYRWLVSRMETEEGRPLVPAGARVQLGYILLPRELDSVGHEIADWSEEVVEDGIERARDVVRMLRSGPVFFDPERRPSFPDPPLEALLGRGLLTADVDDGEES
jgi:hypothetical protein